MAKKGALLEQLVALVQETLKDRSDTVIQTNAKLSDEKNIIREIDVLVSTKVQEMPYQISFECKNYSKKAVDIQVIDALIGKYKHLPQIHRIVIVSTTGFTAKAIERAKQEGILHCSIDNVPLDEIFDSTKIYRAIPDFKLGERITIFYESYNEPVGEENFDSCDCHLTSDDSPIDFRLETIKKLAELKTKMKLAKKFMENGQKPIVGFYDFKFNSSVYIKSRDGRKFNVSEAQMPFFVNFIINDGKIVKQQKLIQGQDVYITENQFENNSEPLSAVVVESGKKHKVVFKYGDTLIESSIRID